MTNYINLRKNCSSPSPRYQRLFSYGTLQRENVQKAVFDRIVKELIPDQLNGFKLGKFTCEDDPEDFAITGLTTYNILIPDKNASEPIKGVLLEVTEEELKKIDDFEGEDYKRIEVTFSSGKTGLVYIQSNNCQK